MYRNATELGAGLRFSATVTGENQSAPRPTFSYDLPVSSHPLFLNTALLSYRPTSNLEIAFGRDQLPTGINIPDLAVFVRSRNRVGYYDSPTQIKAFWWGKRYFVSPYAFGPGGSEQHGDDEFGGGSLAEFDLLGKQRTIVGLNFLRGSSRNGERNLVAPYARIGFGSWGILAEHDFTNRTSNLGLFPSFHQSATYGQFFYYPREWLVASLIGGVVIVIGVSGAWSNPSRHFQTGRFAGLHNDNPDGDSRNGFTSGRRPSHHVYASHSIIERCPRSGTNDIHM